MAFESKHVLNLVRERNSALVAINWQNADSSTSTQRGVINWNLYIKPAHLLFNRPLFKRARLSCLQDWNTIKINQQKNDCLVETILPNA